MLALTFSTGIVDAVGYLGLDKVFAGNMTGNVVILGMALTGANRLPVIGPLIALGAFMLGAAIGGRGLRGAVPGWDIRVSWLLAAVAALLVVATGVALWRPHEQSWAFAVTAMLAAAMGMQAAAARHVAVKDVTTVVVTSTITGMAADSWFGARAGQPWPRRAAAIVLLLAGAAVGALLLRFGLGIALSAAIAVTAGCCLAGHSLGRRSAVTA